MIQPVKKKLRNSTRVQSMPSTVSKMKLREGGKNKNASKIYDIEEEWIIKDLLTWKGVAIPSNFDFRKERF